MNLLLLDALSFTGLLKTKIILKLSTISFYSQITKQCSNFYIQNVNI